MRAHVVLAHPETQSFNAHLARMACRTLEGMGWTTTMSDLYALNFDPCERMAHYRQPANPARFDAQAEQRHASNRDNLPEFVRLELDRMDAADLLILQYPMWWHLPPAMLKGWMDRVFVYGKGYTSAMRFEDGRFRGKRAMLSVTVGTSAETYAFDGRSGDINLLLWPVQFSLAYVGYRVIEPFVAYRVEAGLRYSDPTLTQERLVRIEAEWAARLAMVETAREIPFNRMSEWTKEGRIAPDAPAYSPFIRHRKDLDIA